jgi:hypothetical protein
MLDIGLPSRFGGGELGGGELAAQIIGRAPFEGRSVGPTNSA